MIILLCISKSCFTHACVTFLIVNDGDNDDDDDDDDDNDDDDDEDDNEDDDDWLLLASPFFPLSRISFRSIVFGT